MVLIIARMEVLQVQQMARPMLVRLSARHGVIRSLPLLSVLPFILPLEAIQAEELSHIAVVQQAR